MSLKRSHTSGGRTSSGGGSDSGAKLGRQEFYDELKKLAQSGNNFAPVDVAMAIGAAEAQVSRALLGLAAEGYVEKAETGKYRATSFAEVPQAEFIKALARASKLDSTRQRDLSEIARLKQNNDVMRAKLLAAVAERDRYLAVLKEHGIDPGPAPVRPSAAEPPVPAASAPVAEPPASVAGSPVPAASAPVTEPPASVPGSSVPAVSAPVDEPPASVAGTSAPAASVAGASLPAASPALSAVAGDAAVPPPSPSDGESNSGSEP